MIEHADSQQYRRGTLLDGKYCLTRVLDEGGMSWVWLAHHQTLDLPVAVKIAKSGNAHKAENHPEGRITARLRHPSIIAVLDSGNTPWGDPFLVMEYLTGHTLCEVLRRDGRLPARAAVKLMLSILDALCFCHSRGVVHRDVKPGNIFLSREDGVTQPRLLDFGVAKPPWAATAFPGLAGTPGYMAPEQVHGSADADHRADIWAFCAVLYEAVAGPAGDRGRQLPGAADGEREPHHRSATRRRSAP